MSITPSERAVITRHSSFLLSVSESELRRQVNDPGSPLHKKLSLGSEGAYSQFWIPFDWVNEDADIVIVGLTPGLQQAEEALASMRSSLLMELGPERISERAKSAAAFKGNMRSLGARLMDHFDLHRLFGVDSTDRLFGSDAGRVHYTSVMRYPVLKDGENYPGDERMLKRPYLRDLAMSTLPDEIERIGDPWIITFGTQAAAAVDAMAGLGRIPGDKLLTGILHPSGKQYNRYNVQLGITSPKDAAAVSGGLAVLERSAALRSKVAQAIAAMTPAPGA